MSQQKKLVIQAFRPAGMQMDSNTANLTLGELANAFDQIYNRNSSQLSFEELYRKAYNMVLQKHGDKLYDGVKQVFVKHLKTSATIISESSNEQFLSVLVQEWQSHEVAFNMVKGVLLYMEKFYCPQKGKLPVYDMALQHFRNEVVYHPRIRHKINQQLLVQIEKERNGFVIDRHLVKDVLLMLVALGENDTSQTLQVRDTDISGLLSRGTISTTTVYTEDFEDHFIAATSEFYRLESLDFISQNTCPEYLRKVEQRLMEEGARVIHYLSLSTERRLMECVEKELIVSHARTLIELEGSGLTALLQYHKLDDLRRMYSLFNRVFTCADMLRDGVAKFIFTAGQDIVTGQDANKDPVGFVKSILDLKDKFDEINNVAFKNDKKTAKRMKEAFESFINKDSRTASHLASYIDELLKGGVGGQTDAEVDVKFDKVIVIFRFISDKDVFENYYKNLLSKRLLGSKSVSDDHERAMIAKLKAECGYQYTSKLEGMFQDVGISDSVMKDFKKSAQATGTPIELEVQVLTTGFWPLQTPPPCNLIGSLRELCARFENFYGEKNNGRKLAWMPQLGSVDLKANFPSGRKELNVSTYQCCILMLFNDKLEIALTEMRNTTNIQELELRRHLLSLCTPKLRILNKLSKGKGIDNDDIFTFNSDFTSKMKRIKVPLVAAKEVSINEDAGDVEGIPAQVEEDRRHLTEATIVRVMKARRSLGHNDLIAEVTKQLSSRFSPTPVSIKKRIESLIEREYLQRDSEDPRLYNYLA